MATKKQKLFLEKVGKIMTQRRFGKFSVIPSRRGYSILDPDDEVNHPFLGALSESQSENTLTGGVVIAAIGYGNLDHEFPVAKEKVVMWQIALQERNVESTVILNSPEDMLLRGAYLFIPYQFPEARKRKKNKPRKRKEISTC